jgi:hypothetical protein
MRFMDIPRFELKIEIADFDFFVRSRLSQSTVLKPEQALPLVGYMGWPNDIMLARHQCAPCGGGLRDRKAFRPGFAKFRLIGCVSLTSFTCTAI